MKVKTPCLICAILIILYSSAPLVSGQQDETTIRLALPHYQNEYLVQEAIDDFQAENPELTIEVEYVPLNAYGLTGCRGVMGLPIFVQTDLAGGNAPDIILIESSDIAVVIDDYGPMISSVPGNVVERYTDELGAFSSAMNAFQINSRFVAIPFVSWHYMTFYNLNELEQSGAEYPGLFPTWNDLANLNDGLQQVGIDMGFLNDPALAASFVFAMDGDIDASVSPDTWQDRADTYGTSVDAITRTSNSYAADFGTLLEQFSFGQTGVVLTANSFLNVLKSNNYQEPIAFSALPTLATTSAYSSTNFVLGALVFDNNDGKTDASWQVVNVLFSHPSMIQWGTQNGFLPATAYGFDIFAEDVVQNVWPSQLANAAAVNDMRMIAADSLTWVLPAEFGPATNYIDVVYPTAELVMEYMINDNVSLGAAIDQVIEALNNLSQ